MQVAAARLGPTSPVRSGSHTFDPSTANFAYLAVHDLTLVHLGALAERYFRDDPSTALIKLRQFAKLRAAHHPPVACRAARYLSGNWLSGVAVRLGVVVPQETYVSQKPRCRVLVVEDEAMIAMLVEDMVMDFGSEVVGPATRIDGAIHLARSAEVDAAILDINIDGTDTFSVADVLRERGVPVIFATGYGSNLLPRRFADCPALAKPFSYQALSEALRAALANKPCHTEAA